MGRTRRPRSQALMAYLLDTSLWVDFTRSRSPVPLKRYLAPFIQHPEAHMADPVAFEILRHAAPAEFRKLHNLFRTFPWLATPPGVWEKAAELGRSCRHKGWTIGSLDLLIASVAIHHKVELITFDEDFAKIADVSSLLAKRLQRPAETPGPARN